MPNSQQAARTRLARHAAASQAMRLANNEAGAALCAPSGLVSFGQFFSRPPIALCSVAPESRAVFGFGGKCSIFSFQCAVFSVQFKTSLHTSHYTLHTAHFTLSPTLRIGPASIARSIRLFSGSSHQYRSPRLYTDEPPRSEGPRVSANPTRGLSDRVIHHRSLTLGSRAARQPRAVLLTAYQAASGIRACRRMLADRLALHPDKPGRGRAGEG